MNGPWPRNPLVYEVNARVWAAERGGSLDAVSEEEVRRFAAQGWHAVWLMGVWSPSAASRDLARSIPALWEEYRRALPDAAEGDVVGSPYAVAAYRVAPGLGGEAALARFRERLAAHGIRLMLDFVPNHLARDHPWTEEFAEMFVPGSEEDLAREPGNYFRHPSGRIFAHGRDPYFPGWTDTVQINYASPLARERMREELLRIAELCDGVRCDMAMLVLPEVFAGTWERHLPPGTGTPSFWEEAIPAVRGRHPGFVFLAEAYWGLEGALQEQGFDYTYDKELYDKLRAGDTAGVRAHLAGEAGAQARCARFIENHDEPRAASVFGDARWRSAAAVTFFSPGLKLMHEGQIEGRRVKLPVQLGRRPAEEADEEFARGHEAFLDVLRDPVFRDGAFSPWEVSPAGPDDPTHEAILALRWSPPEPRGAGRGFLVVSNAGGRTAYGRIPFPAPFAEGKWILWDRYDGSRYEREGEEMVPPGPGLFVGLEPGQVHLFEIAAWG